jgi:addiction module HigA family antidote
MSKRQFAKKIGVPASRLNDIVLERRGVTADTVLRLSKALGTTAEFWMNLQSFYDLDMARNETGDKVKRV